MNKSINQELRNLTRTIKTLPGSIKIGSNTVTNTPDDALTQKLKAMIEKKWALKFPAS